MMIKEIVKDVILGVSAVMCRDSKSKVLYYHDVHGDTRYTDMGTPADLFLRHLDAIHKAGFEIVSQITRPERQVMLCFDDGFRGIYDTREIFAHNGLQPTVFLAVSLIGTPGYLDVDQIRTLCDSGFRFQSHGWSHADLTSFGPEELRREVAGSRSRLEEMLGLEIEEICFPIGYYSDAVVGECQRAGYRHMYASVPGGYFDPLGADGLHPRNLVQHATPRQVARILRGGNNLLRSRYLRMHRRPST